MRKNQHNSLFDSNNHGSRVASPLRPAQAAVAGFQKLGFDGEFIGPQDVGYGSNGHK
jgi:hypothetical protein